MGTYPKTTSEVPLTTLAHNLTHTAQQYGDRPAVRLDDYELGAEVWAGPTGKILRREVSSPESAESVSR